MSGKPRFTPEERKARLREQKRAWRERNREKVRATMRAYRAARPGIGTESSRRWRKNNPERYAELMARDNAKRAERIRKDPEYAMRIAEYKQAEYLRTRPKKRDDVMPTWLAGTLPKLPADKRRLHVARSDDEVCA